MKVMLQHMMDDDFPAAWPGHAESVIENMGAEDMDKKSAALIAMHEICRHHQFKKLPERVSADQILQVALPQLLHIAGVCLANPQPELLLLLKAVLKVYQTSMRYEMPAFMGDPATFDAWMQVFIQILQIEVPPPPADADQDELVLMPVWKVRKRAMNIVFDLFNRYGAVAHAMEAYKDFSKFFTEQYCAGLLQVVWEEIKKYIAGAYYPKVMAAKMIRYLDVSVEISQTWVLLKPLVPVRCVPSLSQTWVLLKPLVPRCVPSLLIFIFYL